MTSDVIVAVEDANGNVVAPTDPTASTNIDIALSSAPGGGVLLGTTEVQAINGIADFSGLGIDKIGNNYKMKTLAPSYPTLTQPNSLAFNITSASPTKLAITAGTATLVSSTTGSTASVCGTYTLQLEDGGNNASNATTNMTLALSSTQTVGGAAGSALFYNSSNCSGSAVSSVSVTTGHSSATISMRDPAAETINITVASTGVSAGTYTTKVAPAQFVLSGGPLSVLSGQCSAGFTITTQGANGTTGPVPADTALSFTFLNGGAPTNALAYSDASCTQSLGTSPANVTVTAGTSSKTFYFKDTTAEGPIVVAFAAQQNMVSATTSPSNQAVTFLGSRLSLTSPNLPVVAGGACVGPFAVKVLDAAGNTVTSAGNTLNIGGQTSNTKFYASASCATAVTQFAVTNGVANLYLGDSAVETLNISVTDPTAAPLQMAASSTINLKTYPYKLAWTTPSAATAQTSTGPLPSTTTNPNVCLPMTFQTQYTNGSAIAPLVPITVSLNGAGPWATTGGNYYSDNLCTPANFITSFTLPAGTSSQTVYFQSISPGTFTLTASDSAGVLQTSTAITETTVSEKAWIGARVGGPSVSNSFAFSFGTGQGVGGARTDGFTGATAVHFDRSKHYLFVADYNGARVFKYDYLNNLYLGWIGGFYNNGGNANPASITGPNTNGCLSVVNNTQQTPGWCTGGTATNGQPQTFGNMYTPVAMADDGYNLYVANYNGASVTMYNIATGAFEGWIGTLYSTTTPGVVGAPAFGPATAASSTNPNGATLASTNCTGSTPTSQPLQGFCTGGNNDNSYGNNQNFGSGQIYAPRTILWANNKLYVGVNGQVNMYDATPGSPTMGQFLGWIGWVDPANLPSSCTSAAPTGNAVTPGWCIGGKSINKTPSAGGLNNPTGLYADTVNDLLYVVDSQKVSRYHLSSGTFDTMKIQTGMVNPFAIAGDGTNMYIADWSRVLLTDNQASSQQGWLGKVTGTPPSSPVACSSLNVYDDTPVWCYNGTSMSGLDEKSFNTLTGIDLDGQGNFVTGQRNWPAVKKFNASTGAYAGQMVLDSQAPTTWTTTTEYASAGGFDDKSLNVPVGMAVDTTNNVMFIAEQGNARIKKVSTITGKTLGWIGGITSAPTGGDTACTQLGVAPVGASPGWCLGSLPNPSYLWSNSIYVLANNTPGALYQPGALAYDGSTYLYVTDVSRNRVDRFIAATGVYAGWIGWISSQPTGGAAGCSTASSGFTPGWCIGGASTSSNLDGGMNYPTGITYNNTFLYVVDFHNARVNKYDAVTGAFKGWVGQMGTNTSSCTTAVRGSTTYTKGWCTTSSTPANSSIAARAIYNGDPGGGFGWYTSSYNTYQSIDSDSTYFYVSNDWNNRIDKFWLATGSGHVSGEWAGSLNVQYTTPLPSPSTWTTSPGAWGGVTVSPAWIFPSGLHVDAANDRLYYISDGNAVVQRKLSTGDFIGWSGGISATPSTCTPDGSHAGITPGWCSGGAVVGGYIIGEYSWNAAYLTGDSSYVYVSDPVTHRVTRVPKRTN